MWNAKSFAMHFLRKAPWRALYLDRLQNNRGAVLGRYTPSIAAVYKCVITPLSCAP